MLFKNLSVFCIAIIVIITCRIPATSIGFDQDPELMESIERAIEQAEKDPTLGKIQTARNILYPSKALDPNVGKLRFRYSVRLLLVLDRLIVAGHAKGVPKAVNNLSPPAGNGREIRAGGMDPAGIKNPSERKQYQDALIQNKKFADFWVDQKALEDEKEDELAFLKGLARSLFTSDEAGQRQLREELATLKVPDKLKAEIRAVIHLTR